MAVTTAGKLAARANVQYKTEQPNHYAIYFEDKRVDCLVMAGLDEDGKRTFELESEPGKNLGIWNEAYTHAIMKYGKVGTLPGKTVPKGEKALTVAQEMLTESGDRVDDSSNQESGADDRYKANVSKTKAKTS